MPTNDRLARMDAAHGAPDYEDPAEAVAGALFTPEELAERVECPTCHLVWFDLAAHSLDCDPF